MGVYVSDKNLKEENALRKYISCGTIYPTFRIIVACRYFNTFFSLVLIVFCSIKHNVLNGGFQILITIIVIERPKLKGIIKKK